MQIAFRILAHTPVWVFVLLVYLIWQGAQALRPRTQAVWRMLIVPLVFFGMGLSRLVFARDHALGAAAGMVRGVGRVRGAQRFSMGRGCWQRTGNTAR